MAHRNGFVPSWARRTYLGVSLLKATANAAERLVTAAKRDGVKIDIFLPAGGYRSYWMQGDMKNPSKRAKYNISSDFNLNLLSAPGSSPHGTGNAVDFRGGSGWLQKNAHKFGFSWPLRERDPNHWVHDGKTASSPIPPAKPIVEEIPMSALVKLTGTSAVYLIEEFSASRVSTTNLNAFEAVHGKVITFQKQASLDAVIKAAEARRAKFLGEVAKLVPSSTYNITNELAGVTAAINAIPDAVDKKLDDEQAEILSAVSKLPAATLAAFGLKRA